MRPVKDAVNGGVGYYGVLEDPRPFIDVAIGGENHGGGVFPSVQEVEDLLDLTYLTHPF